MSVWKVFHSWPNKFSRMPSLTTTSFIWRKLKDSFSRYYNITIFWGDFGLSWLTSLQFILCHVSVFYKPTIPQSPPSHLRDYSTCNSARLKFSTSFVPSFDPNEWCLKNGLHSGGWNPGHLGHESSVLTTRPRLLATNQQIPKVQ